MTMSSLLLSTTRRLFRATSTDSDAGRSVVGTGSCGSLKGIMSKEEKERVGLATTFLLIP